MVKRDELKAELN
jgi:hypothetical protein